MSAKEKQSAASAGSAAPVPKATSRNARGAAKSSPPASQKRGPAPRQGARQARKPGDPIDLPQHEAFAQAVAEGLSGAAAYRREISDSCTYETSVVGASKLLANPNVRVRVDELRCSFDRLLVEKLGVKQETIARYLIDVIETPVSEVTRGHKLCQEYHYAETMHGAVEKVKMPSKLEAVEKLVKMAGWNAPEKVEQRLTIEIEKL